MQLVSWNVNGIRASVNKDFIGSFHKFNVDMFCLQETKAQDEQVLECLSGIHGYYIYTNSAARRGYSGTAILTKIEPKSVQYDMGIEEHDQEGRVIAAEFDDFILVTVYTPNSGSELLRLSYRQRWDADFLSYLKKLESNKPLIVCGDLNVAHREVDIARPKANYNKTAGYMQEEIDGMNNLHAAGFVDTYRLVHGDKIKYSWWSFRANARSKNIGWRIDYFLVSSPLAERVVDAEIHDEITGSDHCPVFLKIK